MTQKLFIGNLSYDTNAEALQTLFAEHGEIASVNVVTDRYSGRSRGFAFIEMATEEGAEAAISALNGKSVDNRELRVEKAKPKTDRNRGDRDRSGWGRSSW